MVEDGVDGKKPSLKEAGYAIGGTLGMASSGGGLFMLGREGVRYFRERKINRSNVIIGSSLLLGGVIGIAYFGYQLTEIESRRFRKSIDDNWTAINASRRGDTAEEVLLTVLLAQTPD